MGKYHNVLYIGLKIAWDWGVTDSDVVKMLLRMDKKNQQKKLNKLYAWNARMWHYDDTFYYINLRLISQSFAQFFPSSSFSSYFSVIVHFPDEIFQCEQSFERIFLGAIFGSNAPYFIAGWRSDFLDQVKFSKYLSSLTKCSFIFSVALAW